MEILQALQEYGFALLLALLAFEQALPATNAIKANSTTQLVTNIIKKLLNK